MFRLVRASTRAAADFSREMAVGNTFGATALSSYGGFWIAVAIILTPGFQIESKLLAINDFHASFGIFLMVSRSISL